MDIKSGIYKIENLVNGKVYVGQAVDIKKRLRDHIRNLNKGIHGFKGVVQGGPDIIDHLQCAWNEYGSESFVVGVIEYIEDLGQLTPREQYWMDLTQCYDSAFGYNECKVAGSCRGVKRSEETRVKMSEAKKGENHPLYGKRGENNPNYGKHPTEETKQKISEAKKGAKYHMYGRQGKRGEDNPNYGKHRTEETKQKISESHMGEKNPNYGKGIMLEFMGEAHSIPMWASLTDINVTTLNSRIRCSGWSIEKALTTPVKTKKDKELK